MSKRILAIILSVSLLLSVAPFAMVFGASADTTFAATYYMSGSYSERTELDDGTTAHKFHHLDDLIAAVKAANLDVAGNVIRVYGNNYNAVNNYISGSDTSPSQESCLKATTSLENATLYFTSAYIGSKSKQDPFCFWDMKHGLDGKSDGQYYTLPANMVFDDVQLRENCWCNSGECRGWYAMNGHSLTIKNTTYWTSRVDVEGGPDKIFVAPIITGNENVTVSQDVNLTLEGRIRFKAGLTLARRDGDATGVAVLQKNLNMSFKDATITFDGATGTNGLVANALQVKVEGDTTVKQNGTSGNETAMADYVYTDTAMTTKAPAYFLYPVGIDVEFTETAGVYNVDSTKEIVAVNKTTGVKTTAVNGVLTVPEAGAYTIFEVDENGFAKHYYMSYASTPAADEDGTQEHPFSTMDGLLTAVQNSGLNMTGNRISVQLANNDYNYSVANKSANGVTFEIGNVSYEHTASLTHAATLVFSEWDKRGDHQAAYLSFDKTGYGVDDLTLAGPTEFRNIRFIDVSWDWANAGNARHIDTNGYDCVIENCCIGVALSKQAYRTLLYVEVGASNKVILEGHRLACKAFAGANWAQVRNAEKTALKDEYTYMGYDSLDLTGKAGTYAITFGKASFPITKVEENCAISVAESADYGDTVAVTVSPDQGYALVNIYVNGKALFGNSFEMPTEAVEITTELYKLPEEETTDYVATYYMSYSSTVAADEDGTQEHPFSTLDGLLRAVNASGKDMVGNRISVQIANNNYCYTLPHWTPDSNSSTLDLVSYTHTASLTHKATLVFSEWDKRGDGNYANLALCSQKSGGSAVLAGPTEFHNIRFANPNWDWKGLGGGCVDGVDTNGYSCVLDKCLVLGFNGQTEKTHLLIKVYAANKVVITNPYAVCNIYAGDSGGDIKTAIENETVAYTGRQRVELTGHEGWYGIQYTKTSHTVTKGTATNGSFELKTWNSSGKLETASATQLWGTGIVVVATANTGYVVDKVTASYDGNNVAEAKLTTNGYAFAMPDVDVTVNVEFKKASDAYLTLYTALNAALIWSESNSVDSGMKDVYNAVIATAKASLVDGITAAQSDAAVATLQEGMDFVKFMKVSGASLALYNDLTVRYLLPGDIIPDDVTDLCVHFEIPGSTASLWEADVTEYTAQKAGGKTYYVFSFDGLLPSWINKTITASVSGCWQGHNWSIHVKDYSMKQYALTMLNKEMALEPFKALMVSLLNYSQSVLDYVDAGNDRDFLNEAKEALGVTERNQVVALMEPYKSDRYTDSKALTGTPAQELVQWKGAALNLSESVTMKFYFTATADLRTVAFRFEDEAGNVFVKNEVYQEGNYYVVEFEDLTAAEFSDVFQVEAVRYGTVVSKTLSYSVESYAAAKQSNQTALGALVDALMTYGNTASAFVEAGSPSWNKVQAAASNDEIDWTTYNSAVLFREQHSSYDAQAEAKRLSILSAKDTLVAASGKKTYYISPNGNNNNNGTSTATPWKSADKLKSVTLSAGDVVLFERGGIYYGTSFTAVSGVSYGAYGTGAKPQLYGSPQNYADASLWTSAGENLWKINVGTAASNVGALVFNHGVAVTHYRQTKAELTRDFDFYEDTANHIIYLYLSSGNPGDVYYDIEMNNGKSNVISGSPSNVVIENLSIKYNGYHGIGFGAGTSNVTVRNCDIGYIGGSRQIGYSRFVRYGNGIEFYNSASNILVENNWVYQCYDAGFTNQGKGCEFHDLTVQNNLIEYCQYSIEVWADGVIGETDFYNCQYLNNILRFAGYNFEYDNRLGSNTTESAHIAGLTGGRLICDADCLVSGNVFDTAYRYLLTINNANTVGLGFAVAGNTYIQNSFQSDECGVHDPHATESVVARYQGRTLKCTSQAVMNASVSSIDATPVDVRFEGVKYRY